MHSIWYVSRCKLFAVVLKSLIIWGDFPSSVHYLII